MNIKKIKYYFIYIIILSLMAVITACSSKTDQSIDNLEELRSIPYIAYSSQEIDVTLHNVEIYNNVKAWKGYNLFQNYTNTFFLMNMRGNILHTWKIPLKQSFEYGHLLPNGDLLAVGEFVNFVKVSKDSELIFYKKGIYHHDIEVLEDNSYLLLSAERKPYLNFKLVEFHTIKHYEPDGTLIETWKTLDHLKDLQSLHYPTLIDKGVKVKDNIYDYYHLNTIRVLPHNDLEKNDTRFQKGNWMVCSRNTNLIFIIDKQTKNIVWSWGPDDLDWPHYPYMLKTGALVIFDNGYHRGYTRIIKLDPISKEITWEYTKDPKDSLFTNIRGCAQPLPNNNLLVTESEKSHVFEITPEGEVVWEYYEPPEEDGRRRAIYRMIRYPIVAADFLDKK